LDAGELSANYFSQILGVAYSEIRPLCARLAFGFRQNTGFFSKLVQFNLRTSSESRFYRQFGQWMLGRRAGF